MTNEERVAHMHLAQDRLKDALLPLLTEDDKGIVAIRCFYAVAHGDGVFSAGNFGLTVEDHTDVGARLVGVIMEILTDPKFMRSVETIDGVPKQ